MFADEILLEIDATLDQLIRNVESIESASLSNVAENEIDAFQKTQESLLHRLISMDELLEKKQKEIRLPNKKSVANQIQSKLNRFEKLKNEVNCKIERASKKTPIYLKRKSKRVLVMSAIRF